MSKYVPGRGGIGAKLMVVGNFPNAEEESQGEPFVGWTGRAVQDMFKDAGMPWNEVYRTHVFKYRPPAGDAKRMEATGHRLEDEIPKLWNEINTIKPNVIVPLGNLALKTLCGKEGIHKWRGSILQAGPYKAVPTIHAANAIRPMDDGEAANYHALAYIALDIKRAVEESRSPILNLPRRNLVTGTNARSLSEYVKSRRTNICAVDVETVFGIAVCVAFSFSPESAMTVPLISPHIWSKGSPIPKSEISAINFACAEILDEFDIIGQNYKFDEGKLDIAGLRTRKMHADTMLMMHALYPELHKSLAFMTSIFTREPYYKDEGREFNPYKDDLKKFLHYNCKDSCVTREIYDALAKELEEEGLTSYYFDFYNKLHRLYKEIELVGLGFDRSVQHRLSAQFSRDIAQLQEQLNKLAGYPVNVNSVRKDVPLFLFKTLGLPTRTSTDEDTLTALYGNHAKTTSQKEGIDLLLKIRALKKAKSTSIDVNPDYDERMRWQFRLTGTETGRRSTSQMKPPIRPSTMGVSYHTIPSRGPGIVARELYVADPGYVFVEADLSQAEPRVVATLSNDEWLLQMFEDKKDVHSITAGWFFKLAEDVVKSLTKEDPRRFIGKTGRNGGNYDMGKHRLMQTINTDARKYGINIAVSEKQAAAILTIFHDKAPNIRGVFHKEVREALLSTRRLVDPFGGIRDFYGNLTEEATFKGAYAHLPQRIVSIQIAKALLNIRDRFPSARTTGETHDSGLWLCPKSEVTDFYPVIRSEFERPIDFTRCTLKRDVRLVIPCEIQVGECLARMEKVKHV